MEPKKEQDIIAKIKEAKTNIAKVNKEQNVENPKQTNSEIAEILKTQKISQIIIHGGNEKFNKEKNETELSLTPDLDAQSASIILSFLKNQKGESVLYKKEGARSSIVPKGGNENNLKEEDKIQEGVIVYIDTGNKWLEVEKEGQKTKIYFDHHGEGKRASTSATKMVYDIIKIADPKIDKEIPWLANYVKSVTSFDNLDYLNMKDQQKQKIFNQSYFQNTWPYTLNHLAKHIDTKVLIDLFEQKIVTSFNQSIKKYLDSESELNGEKGKLGDLIKNKENKSLNEIIKQETTKNPNNNINKTIKGIEEADKFESNNLGKVVFHNNKRIKNKNGNGYNLNMIPNHLGFIGTKALGYDTFVVWNKQKGEFFINSNENGLQNIIDQLRKEGSEPVLDIRGVMVKGKIGNMTEEEFIAILKGENILNQDNKTGVKENPKSKLEILKEALAKSISRRDQLKKEIDEIKETLNKIKASFDISENTEPTPEEPEFDLTLPENETSEPEKVGVDENKNQIEKPETKKVVKSVKPDKIDLYFSNPNSDGSFNQSSGRESFTDGASIFALKDIGGERYEVYFDGREQANKLALQFPDKTIDPLFESISAFNPKAKTIQTIKPAIVKLENGKLKLESKGEMDYDEVGIKRENSKSEKVGVDENNENKITSEDFKELVRLSKFFLENPKEPTIVGSIITKYPELFKEINKIEERRQEELDSIEYVDTNIYQGKEIKIEKWIYLIDGFSTRGGGNSKQELVDEINIKYDAELAELEKSKTTTDSNSSSKIEKPETKRDGKENYEGWNTSYHYDLEKIGEEGPIGIKIAKQTSKEGPLSLYEIKGKGDEMVLFLIEKDFTTKMLIDYARTQLEPLFELPNNEEPKIDVRLIKTVRPAKFKKEGEFWVLKEKGEVEYIK